MCFETLLAVYDNAIDGDDRAFKDRSVQVYETKHEKQCESCIKDSFIFDVSSILLSRLMQPMLNWQRMVRDVLRGIMVVCHFEFYKTELK